MKKERIVAISPFNIKGSEFIDLQKACIQKNGFEVVDGSFKNLILHPFKCNKIVAIILNWFEEVNCTNVFMRFLSITKKRIILTILKLHRINIVTVIHNKKSHDFNSYNKNAILRTLLKRSSVVVGLCNETRSVLRDLCGSIDGLDEKIVIVPHPNFINSYKSSGLDFRKQLNIPKNNMVVLFFGTIRKYKNIELLLEAAGEVFEYPISFIVAGKGDDKYASELIQKSKNNVIFINRFIENEEIADLYACCDICIAPLDLGSCMNSSTCLAAFSFKKNIICPKIGTIRDLEKDLTYSYTYKSLDEHLQKLIEMILLSYKEYKENRRTFKDKGIKLFDIVKEKNSLDLIAQRWKIVLDKATSC